MAETGQDYCQMEEATPTTPLGGGGTGDATPPTDTGNSSNNRSSRNKKQQCTLGSVLTAIVVAIIIAIAIYMEQYHDESNGSNNDGIYDPSGIKDSTSGDINDPSGIKDGTSGDTNDPNGIKDGTSGDTNDPNGVKNYTSADIKNMACVKELDSTWPKYPAIIFNTVTKDPVLPRKSESGRNLSFRDGSEVLLACPGTTLAATGETLETLQCSGGTLTINKKVVELGDLGCTKAPKENIKKGAECGVGGILHTIGWTITEDIFEPQIDVCFHPDKETTSYTYHKVYGRSMDAKSIDSKRPSFKSAKYFHVSMTKAYSQKTQKSLFKTLLGSDESINIKKQNYFAKGHLAPDSDFVYGYQQDATYYFLNAVPQWQAFNNGNWKALEFSVRDLAVLHDRDLEVWTGALGVLQMIDMNNNPVEIILGKSYKKDLIPAPALMWKAIYEKSSDSGVAFVGVNNPYATELTDDLRICQDICDQVSWMDWDRDDWAHGYMYCCSLDDLQSALPPALTLPQGVSLLVN